MKTKVCFNLDTTQVEKFKNACYWLGCSQRTFIQMAITREIERQAAFNKAILKKREPRDERIVKKNNFIPLEKEASGQI